MIVYHLPGNVISATVGLVYINLQPVYELPISTRFRQFRKFGKIAVGGIVDPSQPKESFPHGVRIHMRVRFDLPTVLGSI